MSDLNESWVGFVWWPVFKLRTYSMLVGNETSNQEVRIVCNITHSDILHWYNKSTIFKQDVMDIYFHGFCAINVPCSTCWGTCLRLKPMCFRLTNMLVFLLIDYRMIEAQASLDTPSKDTEYETDRVCNLHFRINLVHLFMMLWGSGKHVNVRRKWSSEFQSVGPPLGNRNLSELQLQIARLNWFSIPHKPTANRKEFFVDILLCKVHFLLKAPAIVSFHIDLPRQATLTQTAEVRGRATTMIRASCNYPGQVLVSSSKC